MYSPLHQAPCLWDVPDDRSVSYLQIWNTSIWYPDFSQLSDASSRGFFHTQEAMQSQPLLPGSPPPRQASARMVAAGVATLAAVAAVGAVAVIVNGGGPVSLMGIKLSPVVGLRACWITVYS